MATIKDIARMAGVSITTVSRVLNHHPYVSDEKRQKVEAIIAELNYYQNPSAIHLVKGKTQTLGIILPHTHTPAFQLMISGMMEAAFSHQYSTICCSTGYSREQELEYLSMLQKKQVDGIIVCSHSSSWEEMKAFAEYGPIVACEYVKDVPCVYTDHYEAFLAGMRYLRECGHRDIGYCTGRPNGPSSRRRMDAYRQFSGETDRPLNENWIFESCFSLDDGKRVAKELSAMQQRPSALLANGDEVAAGILLQAKLDGLAVPEELSVVGCDNQPFSEALELSAIDQHYKEIGKEAVNLLLANQNQQICIPHTIIDRGTIKHFG